MDLDLNDPRLFLRADVLDDPRPLYDTLRRHAPVWRLPGQDVFLISAPALIREVVGHPAVYSSNLVKLLHNDGSGCPATFPLLPFGDSIHVLSTADPPIHTRHRKLLQSHLTPMAVGSLEPAVRSIVAEYLDAFVAAGGGEFVGAFSDPVPAEVICSVVGLPRHDVARVITMVSDTGALLDGITDRDGIQRAMHSAFELTIYLHEQFHAALQLPAEQRSGLIAVFSEAVGRGLVTADEVINMLVVLVSAGSETTSSLLATVVETLARNPELQQQLREDPERIPLTIEDCLRDNGPFQFHYRCTTNDTTLGGVRIPAESTVMLMWAAANRPEPGEAHEPHDDTSPPQHYAFGKGMHFCIGAPLARLEARVAIEHLLASTTSFSLDAGASPTRRPSIFIRRHASLPIVVEQ